MVPRFRTEFFPVRLPAIRAARNSTDKYVPRRVTGDERWAASPHPTAVVHWKSREESELYSELAYGPRMQAIYGITRAHLLHRRNPD